MGKDDKRLSLISREKIMTQSKTNHRPPLPLLLLLLLLCLLLLLLLLLPIAIVPSLLLLTVTQSGLSLGGAMNLYIW